MYLNELNEIIKFLKSKGEMNFLESASETEIERFEAESGITLPTKYREWLLFSDGGEFFLPGGLQLYGVIHKPVINPNDDSRPNDNYYEIGALATGDPILCQKDSEKISIYNLEGGCIEEDEVYEDFFSFLGDLPEIVGVED